MSDDGRLDLHSWCMKRKRRRRGAGRRSGGDGLRRRGTSGRRGSEDSGKRKSGVLDGQMWSQERLGLEDGQSRFLEGRGSGTGGSVFVHILVKVVLSLCRSDRKL